MLKFTAYLLLLASAFQVTLVAGNNGTCEKCKIIRERNSKKHNPYIYYEDYLKAKENGEIDDEDEGAMCEYTFEENNEK